MAIVFFNEGRILTASTSVALMDFY